MLSLDDGVAGIGANLTPRSRADHLRDYITHSKHSLPRLLPLHTTPPPKSPTRLPSLGSPPPPFGSSPSFGSSSPFGSQRPVTLDEMSENMRSIRLPPLNENYETCMKGCKKTCRTKHPRVGGTNRRRKNRKQKGTRRHGSRRYRR